MGVKGDPESRWGGSASALRTGGEGRGELEETGRRLQTLTAPLPETLCPRRPNHGRPTFSWILMHSC